MPVSSGCLSVLLPSGNADQQQTLLTTYLFDMPDLSLLLSLLLLLLLVVAGSAIASLWHVLCQRRFDDATLTSMSPSSPSPLLPLAIFPLLPLSSISRLRLTCPPVPPFPHQARLPHSTMSLVESLA